MISLIISSTTDPRRYLASCTLQFKYNLTKIRFQGRHFNYFCVLLYI